MEWPAFSRQPKDAGQKGGRAARVPPDQTGNSTLLTTVRIPCAPKKRLQVYNFLFREYGQGSLFTILDRKLHC